MHTYINTYIHTCMHTYIYIYVYEGQKRCVCVYLYIYIHIIYNSNFPVSHFRFPEVGHMSFVHNCSVLFFLFYILDVRGCMTTHLHRFTPAITMILKLKGTLGIGCSRYSGGFSHIKPFGFAMVLPRFWPGLIIFLQPPPSPWIPSICGPRQNFVGISWCETRATQQRGVR